jgi:hypothetical protein
LASTVPEKKKGESMFDSTLTRKGGGKEISLKEVKRRERRRSEGTG